MKKYVLLFIFTSCFYAQNNDLNFRYSYNGNKPITVIDTLNDFLYKGSKNSFFKKQKSNLKCLNRKYDKYLFTEFFSNSSFEIIFCLTNAITIEDKVYNNKNRKLSYFTTLNNDSVKKYSLTHRCKKYILNEYYYKLNKETYLKIITKSNELINSIENNLFIGFEDFLNKNKDRPSKILKVFNFFLFKDYNAQLDLIKKFDKNIYTSESLYGSVLVDLNTNNGSFNKIKKLVSRRIKIEIDTTQLIEFDNYIRGLNDSIDIVMFNEFHSYPHTRYNFMFALKKLKEKGFQYLALETLPAPNENDSLITKPENISGYYVEEPTCSLMINYAVSLGFKLVAYEEADQCVNFKDLDSRNCRDSIQALNIAKIYDYDKNAKVLVFGGHAHIEKKTRDDWKFMRVVLQEIFPNKKFFSIGQTKYIRTNLDSVDIPIKKPLVYSSNDSQFDAHLISPFYEKYYEWYYTPSEFMTHKIVIPKDKYFFSIEIIPVYNNKEIYYPIFRSTKQNLQGYTIYLPKNMNYKVIFKDKNNKRL